MRVLILLLPFLVIVGAGAGMIVAGLRMQRRITEVPRVAVEAVVVTYSNWTRPTHVVFDYPAPDGRWLRARRVVGVPLVQRQGLLVRAGDRLTVFVNPQQPHDVNLGPVGSAGGVFGIVLMIGGAAVILFGLTMALSFIGPVLR